MMLKTKRNSDMSNSTYKTACHPNCSIGNYHMYTNDEIGSQRIRINTTSSLPMFKLSRTWCHACLTILHIIQTSKNHNPGFERKIPPIFSLLPSEMRAICYQIAATSPNSPFFLMCLNCPYQCSNSQRTGCHALLWFSTSIKPVRIIIPKFWSENESTPIFPRYSPLNLEQFGVLNDTHALQKVPHNLPRLPTTNSIPRLTHLKMLPATYSYTHHKKHFEFLLQLMSRSHPARLLRPECRYWSSLCTDDCCGALHLTTIRWQM